MKRQWTTEELVEQWTLQADDLAWLANKTGATRLGFATLLKYFQHEGRFPQSKHEVPGAIVTYLATQLGLAPDFYIQYDWQGRSIKDHRAQVRTALGVRESTVADAEAITAWLVEHTLPQEHQDEHLREALYQRSRDLHLEPPTQIG